MGMIEKKTWEEFRATGLLWWINRILHTFGWAIVLDVETEGELVSSLKVIDAYPARVKFRGFERSIEEEGFVKISEYLKDNAKKLLEETNE